MQTLRTFSFSGLIFFLGWEGYDAYCTLQYVRYSQFLGPVTRAVSQHCSPKLTYCPTPPTPRVLFRVISLTADNAFDNILENIFPGTPANAGLNLYIHLIHGVYHQRLPPFIVLVSLLLLLQILLLCVNTVHSS